MKDSTKKGILSGMCLENLSEEFLSIVEEIQEETKPSRLKNKLSNKKKKHKGRREDDEFED